MIHWLRDSYGYDIREVPDLLKAPVDNVIKFTVYHPSACEEMCAPLFTPTWQTKAKIASSGKEWMDCNPLGVNKGTALVALGEMLGIPRESIMACGDGDNDVHLLREVGFGVAMANAQPQVKEAADYITASNDEDGVARAIEKFALHR